MNWQHCLGQLDFRGYPTGCPAWPGWESPAEPEPDHAGGGIWIVAKMVPPPSIWRTWDENAEITHRTNLLDFFDSDK